MFSFATCIAISPTPLLCAVCADPWRGTSAWFSLGGCILYNTALLSAWRKQQKSTPSLSVCFMSKTTVVCVWKWGIQQKCSLPWWGIEWDMSVISYLVNQCESSPWFNGFHRRGWVPLTIVWWMKWSIRRGLEIDESKDWMRNWGSIHESEVLFPPIREGADILLVVSNCFKYDLCYVRHFSTELGWSPMTSIAFVSGLQQSYMARLDTTQPFSEELVRVPGSDAQAEIPVIGKDDENWSFAFQNDPN